jgi:hypothetical protein
MSFYLQEITQINNNQIKVEFSKIPLQFDKSATNDALNPSNYSISGPGWNIVEQVDSVSRGGASIYIDL